MGYILCMIVGILIGAMSVKLYQRTKPSDGAIVVNKSDPDYATFGIKFYRGANDLVNRKHVMLDIKETE